MFTRKNVSVKLNNQFIWFKKWVLHRQTIEQLSRESKYSIRSLKTLFHNYLSQAPVLKYYSNEWLYLLIDGTYFSNDICLIIYRDDNIKFTQLYRITDGEHYTEIQEDLQNLLLLGIKIKSITSDGHKAILKAVKHSNSTIIFQRCLVHIQRECSLWLTAHPKTIQGFSLLTLVHQLHLIETEEQKQQWIKQLYDWHLNHKDYINQKTINPNTNRFWYTHKLVRRAFIHLKNALPNMFEYLQDNKIPKTTNGLESFFGHLKSHIKIHRELTKEHRKNFIKWYLFFRNR